MRVIHSRGDGRHAGRDILEGEGGDRGGERPVRVGAAPRAPVSPREPRPTARYTLLLIIVPRVSLAIVSTQCATPLLFVRP